MTTATTSNPSQRNARPTPAEAGAVEAAITPTAVAASQSIAPEQRQAMICDAAYFLSERRGFGPGHELDDWLAAEGEIDRLLAASAPVNRSGG
jgi:Protein of unknown function (DUF2934)